MLLAGDFEGNTVKKHSDMSTEKWIKSNQKDLSSVISTKGIGNNYTWQCLL